MHDEQKKLNQKIDEIPMKVCEGLQMQTGIPLTSTGASHGDGIPNTTVESIHSNLAQQLESLSITVNSIEKKFDTAINSGSLGNISSSSVTSTVAVEAVVYTLESNELSTIPQTFAMSNRTNVMDAWRMWWSGSRRCGEDKTQLVRPFKDINIDHFKFTGSGKKNKKSWQVWKQVMEYLTSELDDLKDRKVYDWRKFDPVAPRTQLFLAQLIPSAPPKESARRRRVTPSSNSVGTVRKNMSLRAAQ